MVNSSRFSFGGDTESVTIYDSNDTVIMILLKELWLNISNCKIGILQYLSQVVYIYIIKYPIQLAIRKTASISQDCRQSLPTAVIYFYLDYYMNLIRNPQTPSNAPKSSNAS